MSGLESPVAVPLIFYLFCHTLNGAAKLAEFSIPESHCVYCMSQIQSGTVTTNPHFVSVIMQ